MHLPWRGGVVNTESAEENLDVTRCIFVAQGSSGSHINIQHASFQGPLEVPKRQATGLFHPDILCTVHQLPQEGCQGEEFLHNIAGKYG